MKKPTYNPFLILVMPFLLALSCKRFPENNSTVQIVDKGYVSFVNPFIGTEGNGTKHSIGNVHPGAVRPWGMVSVSPQSFDFTKMQSPSVYRHEEEKIYAFSNVNFSGVGCPGAGSIPFKFFTRELPTALEGSYFSEQVAVPGYYSVLLNDDKIKVHATATKRSSLIKLELPKGSTKVFLDLTAQQGHVKGGVIKHYTNNTVKGYQLEGNFCGTANRTAVYFSAHFNKDSDSTYLRFDNTTDPRFNQNIDTEPSGIVYVFENEAPTELLLKVGVSYVSTANAGENVTSEQTGFDFEKVKEEARQEWETELGKIRIASDSGEDKMVFYTALYHSLLMPMTYSDHNGDYLKMGGREIGKSPYTRYTAFSLWDTYRTTHPLMTLVYPGKQKEFVQNMLDSYDESGWLPKWPIFDFETHLMVGDPASIVIGDTYTKGIRDFDAHKAYEAMTKSADYEKDNLNRRGIKDYNTYGYIAMDGEFSNVEGFQWNNGIVWGAVSNTMELNLADYNIAQMAKSIGLQEDYEKYLQRSKSFMYLYNDEIGLLQPKNKDGSWYEPFDPTQQTWERMNFGLRGGPGFVEGSAWQYLFSIPHGIDTLKTRMGKEQFLKKLDTIFEEGHFDMTNEPGFGFPFFYNLTKERDWKTAHTVHGLLEEHFPNAPNGLPGNDDAGAMSSWVVFAMMGLYPHTPGNPEYMVSVPVLDKIEIQLDPNYYHANQIVIERKGEKNGRIKSIFFGEDMIDYKIDHERLTSYNKPLIIETGNDNTPIN